MTWLEKLTSRNFLAVGTALTGWGLLTYVLTQKVELLDNPVVTALLGSFITLQVLVYQFYFRRAEETTQ